MKYLLLYGGIGLETANPWGFWDYFATATDIASWIALLITIGTLFTTVGIKKSLLLYVEKSEYLKDIDNRIMILRSYEETLKKDSAICGSTIYDWVIEQLDDILINYGTFLKRKNLKLDIEELLSLAEKSKKSTDLEKAASNYQRKLHALCTKLEKEKKLI